MYNTYVTEVRKINYVNVDPSDFKLEYTYYKNCTVYP